MTDVPSAEEVVRDLYILACKIEECPTTREADEVHLAMIRLIEADRERISAAERERCMDEIDHCGCLDAATYRLRRAPDQKGGSD